MTTKSSPTKITTKLKDKVWKDYTKKTASKNELKQMFLGKNPTDAYKKISIKLKKKIDEETGKSSKKVLKPKKPISPNRKMKVVSIDKASSKKSKMSPSRKNKKSPKRK